MFSAFQSTTIKSPLQTDGENSGNPCIIVDDILPQNWPKMQFRIWRSAVAPSDATEKNSNIDAQIQSILYTAAKNILENLLPMTFGAHNVLRSEPFLDYLYEV